MAEINLLPQEEKSAENILKLQKTLTIASFVTLIICAILTLGTLIFFTIYAQEKNKLNLRVEDSSAGINGAKAKEELLVVVKKKTSSADKILTSRVSQTEVLEGLAQITPTGVAFNDVKIADLKLNITGKAKSSLDMAGFVSSLVSAKGVEIVTDVSIDSLSSDDKGVYSFSLTAQLVKSVVKSE